MNALNHHIATAQATALGQMAEQPGLGERLAGAFKSLPSNVWKRIPAMGAIAVAIVGLTLASGHLAHADELGRPLAALAGGAAVTVGSAPAQQACYYQVDTPSLKALVNLSSVDQDYHVPTAVAFKSGTVLDLSSVDQPGLARRIVEASAACATIAAVDTPAMTTTLTGQRVDANATDMVVSYRTGQDDWFVTSADAAGEHYLNTSVSGKVMNQTMGQLSGWIVEQKMAWVPPAPAVAMVKAPSLASLVAKLPAAATSVASAEPARPRSSM